MFPRSTLLACLLAAAPFARAATVDIAVGDANGGPLAGAVVMLVPEGARAPVKPMADVAISQHDKQFDPQVTVVTVGTPVQFPNNDTVRHHVYSFSAAKTFQLKLYAGVPHAPIVFDKPGVAVLGCNIHDQMVAWVVVTDTPYTVRSAVGGHAKLENVPAGSYTLRVWHQSLAEAAAPQEIALTIGPADVEQRVRLTAAGIAR